MQSCKYVYMYICMNNNIYKHICNYTHIYIPNEDRDNRWYINYRLPWKNNHYCYYYNHLSLYKIKSSIFFQHQSKLPGCGCTWSFKILQFIKIICIIMLLSALHILRQLFNKLCRFLILYYQLLHQLLLLLWRKLVSRLRMRVVQREIIDDDRYGERNGQNSAQDTHGTNDVAHFWQRHLSQQREG